MSHHYRRLLRRPWVGVPAREAQHRAVTAVPPSLPFLFLLSSPFLFPSLYFFLLSFCSLLILLSQYLRPRPGAGVRERSTGLLPKTPLHSPPCHSPSRRLVRRQAPPPEPLGARRTVSRLVFLGPPKRVGKNKPRREPHCGRTVHCALSPSFLSSCRTSIRSTSSRAASVSASLYSLPFATPRCRTHVREGSFGPKTSLETVRRAPRGSGGLTSDKSSRRGVKGGEWKGVLGSNPVDRSRTPAPGRGRGY